MGRRCRRRGEGTGRPPRRRRANPVPTPQTPPDDAAGDNDAGDNDAADDHADTDTAREVTGAEPGESVALAVAARRATAVRPLAGRGGDLVPADAQAVAAVPQLAAPAVR